MGFPWVCDGSPTGQCDIQWCGVVEEVLCDVFGCPKLLEHFWGGRPGGMNAIASLSRIRKCHEGCEFGVSSEFNAASRRAVELSGGHAQWTEM
jgi:hypothetical protein